MAENIQRTKGRPQSYKFDRGGQPAEFGPFIGMVKNNVDPTRSGRLQVYIEQFAGDDPENAKLWRTVSYIPPFYGVTPRNNASGSTGKGSYEGNQNTYGMWFTPPDIGVQVICFFVAGDPNQGYYLGCVPDPGVSHMIPAVGASRKFETQSETQKKQAEYAKAQQLPVVEINQYNDAIYENPRFFDQPKPVHSYVFTILMNQGLLGDYIRGPITSSSQRETPSAVFGISTPGRAIYQGGLSEKDIKARVASGSVKLADVRVEGRRGGHSLVMDDGDLEGRDNLIRIRTAKGHQITMSDEADCFYFIHANGQVWIEFGSEGTVDVYSTNSVNIRTQGTINLHADEDININTKKNFNLRAGNVNIESQGLANVVADNNVTVYSKTLVGVASDGGIALDSQRGSWNAGSKMILKASRIDLNGGPAPEKVTVPAKLAENQLDDTKFETGKGWSVGTEKIKTIVTRAPTHEPYPYHNKGVAIQTSIVSGGASETPAPAATTAALNGATNTPVSAPITASNVFTEPRATASIGSLSSQQVTGLLAQQKKVTGQNAGVISVDKGIGAYGFRPNQLEASGYLKPGTLQKISNLPAQIPTTADIAQAQQIVNGGGQATSQSVAQQRKINQLLTSPTVWTGKSGVSDLNSLLRNPVLQATTQQNLMSTTYRGLQTAGVIKGTEGATQLGALVQGASVLGVGSMSSWARGIAPPGQVSQINSIVKNAQYATSFVTKKLGSLLGGSSSLAIPSVDTVDRAALDRDLISSLDNSKIPPPEFSPLERPEFVPSRFEESRATLQKAIDEYNTLAADTQVAFEGILDQLYELQSSGMFTYADISGVESEYNSVKNSYESEYSGLLQTVNSSVSRASTEVQGEFASAAYSVTRLAQLIKGLSDSIRILIRDLKASLA